MVVAFVPGAETMQDMIGSDYSYVRVMKNMFDELNAWERVKSPKVTLPMRTGPVATVPSLDEE